MFFHQGIISSWSYYADMHRSMQSAFHCVSVFPPQLISLIENNSVVVVRGSTGSGKTTLLPQFILDHYSEKNLSCNIVVTQPRKIGATSIARWVAAQRHCTLGSLVGYQVGRFLHRCSRYLWYALENHTLFSSSLLLGLVSLHFNFICSLNSKQSNSFESLIFVLYRFFFFSKFYSFFSKLNAHFYPLWHCRHLFILYLFRAA